MGVARSARSAAVRDSLRSFMLRFCQKAGRVQVPSGASAMKGRRIQNSGLRSELCVPRNLVYVSPVQSHEILSFACLKRLEMC